MYSFLKRKVKFLIVSCKQFLQTIFTPKFNKHTFTCNVCGWRGLAPLSLISARETSSCRKCGSTLRFRSIVNVLTKELNLKNHLFNKSSIDILDLKRIKGIGLSDSPVYANLLFDVFSYTNTFYHKEPKLDISDLSSWTGRKFDFVIASDVFEHIPIYDLEKSFFNLHLLLNKNGLLIFSVPYQKEIETIEHFPNLNKWNIFKKNKIWILENVNNKGEKETYRNLRFHGGEGSTLEMRIFSLSDLFNRLKVSGFCKIKLFDLNKPDIGIINFRKDSFVITARAK